MNLVTILLPHSIKNVAKQGEESYDQRGVNLLRPGGGQFESAGSLFLGFFGGGTLHRPVGGQFDRFFHDRSPTLFFVF
jgi:hypothetical protein